MIGIDPYMALLVDRIIQATGCKVVLSSTWRLFPETREEVKKQVCEYVDITPRLFSGIYALAERGHEIKQWLEEDEKRGGAEVERYAILDDNNDMLPEQQENFFKTSWSTGLTQEIANQVIAHLNYEETRTESTQDV